MRARLILPVRVYFDEGTKSLFFLIQDNEVTIGLLEKGFFPFAHPSLENLRRNIMCWQQISPRQPLRIVHRRGPELKRLEGGSSREQFWAFLSALLLRPSRRVRLDQDRQTTQGAAAI